MALRSEVDPQMKAVQDCLIALLCTTHWVTGNLYGVIVKAKEISKEDKSRLKTKAHEEWMEWIRGGNAHGLRRQHRFLRTPQAWTQGTVGRPGLLLDQEAKARQERGDWDLRLLTGVLGDAEAPLGAQAEVEEQANQWAGHWGENDAELNDEDERPLVEETQLRVPRITVSQLERAAKSFPDSTGLG